MHGSTEVTEAAENPVLRQYLPALLASVQIQTEKGTGCMINLRKIRFKCDIPHVREQWLMQSSQRLCSCTYAGASWRYPAMSPQVHMLSLNGKGSFSPCFTTTFAALSGTTVCYLAVLAGGLVWDGDSLFLCRNRSLWLTMLNPLGASSSYWAYMYWSILLHQQNSTWEARHADFSHLNFWQNPT